MEVRLVEKSDMAEMAKWWESRGKNAEFPSHCFSDLGFIVPGEAAVFLYTTNSKLAFIENLQANPDVPRDRRNDALNAVISAAFIEAKARRFTHLLATTKLSAVCERAKMFGGHIASDMNLIVIPLGGS